MKNNKTELVFILDRSGSMAGLESDTIGGFNSMLEKQRALEGECRITTVLFDNFYELLHDRIDIKAVRPMSEKEYFVRGSTALIDAIGRTVNKLRAVQASVEEPYRAEKVMFVIITDGAENSSREFTASQVRRMIEEQKELGWEFIFLGANIDAVETAGRFGIGADRAVDYVSDSHGTVLNYQVMSRAVSAFRGGAPLQSQMFEEIRQDKKKRGWKK